MTTDNQSIPPLPKIPLLRTGKVQVRDFTLEEMHEYATRHGDARAAHAREQALEEAQSICKGCEVAFTAIANSDIVTAQGKTVHASMAAGAHNCANEIKELK